MVYAYVKARCFAHAIREPNCPRNVFEEVGNYAFQLHLSIYLLEVRHHLSQLHSNGDIPDSHKGTWSPVPVVSLVSRSTHSLGDHCCPTSLLFYEYCGLITIMT